MKDHVRKIKTVRATVRENIKLQLASRKIKNSQKSVLGMKIKKKTIIQFENRHKDTDRHFTKEDRYTSANKYMKKCSKSFPKISLYANQNGEVKKKIKITLNSDKNVEEMHYKHFSAENGKWYSHSGKSFGSFLIKLNIQLPYDPAVSLLRIYPREMRLKMKTPNCT